MVELQHVGIALLLLVVAAGNGYFMYWGFKRLKRGWTIWRNEPVDAGSVHLESDVVEVQGEVEPIDGGLLSTRYTDQAAVAYDFEYKEKQRKRSADGGDEWEWETVESGSVARPFYVVDETGRVAVDPDGATVTLNSEKVSSGYRSRKYEGRLEPGDFVHVYGHKRDALDGEAPGEESVFIGDSEETDAFTVSDTTQFRTFLRYAAKGGGAMVLATLAFGLIGLLTLVFLEEIGVADFGLMML